MKKWYKLTYEGGWVKCNSLDEVTAIASRAYYKGKVRKVIEVVERDISIKELEERLKEDK